jgi:hypothetical protein
VIGLFRAAEKQVAEKQSEEPAPSQARGKPERAPTPTQAKGKPEPAPTPTMVGAGERAAAKPRRISRRRVFLGSAVVLAFLVLTTVVSVWRSAARDRFPEPRLGRARPVKEEQLESFLAGRPAASSVPGLEERVPQLVPGLEQVDPGYSPCLTPDLRSIVFAHKADSRTGYDLYLATRDDVSEPFGQPQRIERSVSREMEAYPTLSPDELELIFVRSHDRPRFFRCTRPMASGDFGDAVAWEPPGLTPTESHRLQRPQFIDALSVMFAMISADGRDRSLWTADRTSSQGPFAPVRKFELASLWPSYFFSENGLRAYFGYEKGISVALRRSKEERFSDDVLLIDAEVTGPIEGTIWVVPQEDVIFYCSPGPGEEIGSARRLWMLRF